MSSECCYGSSDIRCHLLNDRRRFVRIRAFVTLTIDGGGDVVVGIPILYRLIVKGCSRIQTGIHLRVRAAGGHTAINVVAGDTRRLARSPRKGYLRGNCQGYCD